jgi:hypothetical protein
LDIERKRVLKTLKKLEIKGLKDKDMAEMVDKWRRDR